MIKFCEIMGWGFVARILAMLMGILTLVLNRVLAAVLDHFIDRLRAGARADLLKLSQITFVKSRTAYATMSSFPHSWGVPQILSYCRVG